MSASPIHIHAWAVAFLLTCGVARADEISFSNGKAASHATKGLICTQTDENQFVEGDGGFEVLTITGTPEHKYKATTSNHLVWKFHGQPDVIAVDVQIGGDGTASVCFSSKHNGKAKVTVQNLSTGAFSASYDCYSFSLIPRATSKENKTNTGKGEYSITSKPAFENQFLVPGFALGTRAEDKGDGTVEDTVEGTISLSILVFPSLKGKNQVAQDEIEAIMSAFDTRADKFKRSLVVKNVKHQASFHKGLGEVRTGRRIEMKTPAINEMADANSPEEAKTIFGISGTKGGLGLVRNTTIVPEKDFEVMTSPMAPGRDLETQVPVTFAKIKINSEIDTTVTVHVESTATGKNTWCSTEMNVEELVFQLRPLIPEPFVQNCPANQ